VHTGWSVDAGLGGATLTPEDAVRFARGEQVTASSGQPVRLSRPLDWVAVTDHSDAMGTVAAIREGNPEMMKDATLKRWHDMMSQGPEEGTKATMELVAAQANKKLPADLTDPKWAKTYWDKNIEIMERYNDRGRFTAFIAYEWTSNAGGGNNLHRNVIYRDGKQLAEQVLPMTTFTSENPEDLWKWMADWEKKTGGQLLAIPHNGNLSNGRMFELQKFMGGPMTKEWAAQRQKYEPLFEAIQMKGQSESHPSLSTTDEFAVGYELWDRGNLALVPKKPGMIEHGSAAGSQGWSEARAGVGVNPSSTAGRRHRYCGLTAARKTISTASSSVPSRARPLGKMRSNLGAVVRAEMTAAGYTGVWATENTRAAIWDAMKRRETYATSGPRMTVRFFGGYDFVARMRRRAVLRSRIHQVCRWAAISEGAGGQVPDVPGCRAKDPFSGNLDRIRSSRAGWTRAASCRKRSTTLLGRSDKRKLQAATAGRQYSESRPPAGPTRSAIGIDLTEGYRVRSGARRSATRGGVPDAILDFIRRTSGEGSGADDRERVRRRSGTP
jgi:hypothetical protein